MRGERTTARALTIAGSDSGGGAGIQADLKTFAAHRVYGASVITAVTAQNTLDVLAVQQIAPDLVKAQIDAVFDDIGFDAVKIGMVGGAAIIEAVTAGLEGRPDVPIVLDPVMVAKSGAALLEPEAVDALIRYLVPLAMLITPNHPEAERLSGLGGESDEERRAIGERLQELGPKVLLKGGHVGGETIVDLLHDGEEWHEFAHPRLETSATHGTGCTLSSAIAARLARGESLRTAVGGAIDYVHGAIESAYPIGSGHGPVDHLYEWARGA